MPLSAFIRPSALWLCALTPLLAQSPETAARSIPAAQKDLGPLALQLREYSKSQSQIPHLLHHLCDQAGPRLTASPNYLKAAQWLIQQGEIWKLKGHMESWDFKHPGWANLHASIHALEPFQSPLHAEVLAWTPSTPGLVQGKVTRLDLPEEPTSEELEALFAPLRGKLKNKIVMVRRPRPIDVLLKAYQPRRSQEELAKRLDPTQTPQTPNIPFDRGAPKRPGALRSKDLDQLLHDFFAHEKAVARIQNAGLRNGQIRAFSNRSYDIKRAVPTVVMRAEDYGRIWRLLDQKTPVKLSLEIKNRVFPENTQGHNVILELPGSTHPDEVILLGAHLDSWHTSAGATDNAANCAVIVEALRMIRALDLKPKRTLRVVLFDGEEQGLLGSQAFVEKHYGSFEKPKADFHKLHAFINLDGGAGQIRGLQVFGPPEAASVLREYLAPFKDMGVVGAIQTRTRLPKPDYADVTTFTHAGLPGISPMQDGLEYMENTWHTSVDSPERVPMDDVQANAAILAYVAFELANRSEPMPRFTAADLPPIPEMPKP